MNKGEESKLQNIILSDIRSMPSTVCFKVESSSDNGVPDIFFTTKCTGGVFIEVKKPRDSVTSSVQNIMNTNLNKNGCRSFFCKSWREWVDIKIKLNLE